jgi:hypothetical protein
MAKQRTVKMDSLDPSRAVRGLYIGRRRYLGRLYVE